MSYSNRQFFHYYITCSSIYKHVYLSISTESSIDTRINMKDKVTPVYVIVDNGKDVYKSTSQEAGIKEFSRQKYLLGFETTKTALVITKREQDKLDRYLEEATEHTFDSTKASHVLIDRIHRNRALKRRLQLVMRYEVNSA
jgi:hypothetical protein